MMLELWLREYLPRAMRRRDSDRVGGLTPLRYAVVTPARNEERNLRRLGAALAAQTLPPREWIVVDDGSTDATPAILAELAAEHAWVRPLDRAGRRPQRQARRRPPRRRATSTASCYGARSLSRARRRDRQGRRRRRLRRPTSSSTLIGRFAADETLGIASGTCYEQEDGDWVRRTKAETTRLGRHARLPRATASPDVMALEPCMGWDGLDEIRVQLRGMRTQTFVDLPFRHHRPEGGRELTSLHQGEALGRASWYMGYRPSYLALRALYRARREPAALAMLWGYAARRGAARAALPGRAAGARAARAPAARQHPPPRLSCLLTEARTPY